MKLVLIAAMGSDRTIGIKGRMPWHMPADFAHFKEKTANYPLLMGRTTFDSLPGLLPGRRHIVVTRQTNWQRSGCEVFPDITDALQSLQAEPLVMVIGGSSVYEQTLASADQVLLTEINHAFAGDRFFPTLNSSEWQEVSRDHHPADEKNIYDYDFVVYQRRTGKG